MFTRILVPTDFSGPSDAALAHARSLARTFDASLHFLHIVEDPLVAGPFGAEMFVPQTPGTVTTRLEAARTRLNQSVTAEDRSRLRVTTDVIIGSAARTIIDYAGDNAYDLIVIGTHGRSGVAHLLMGSVAEHVVRAAPCPVLTVREAPIPTALRVSATRLAVTA